MTSHVRVPSEDLTPERLDIGFYSTDYYAVRAKLASIAAIVEPIGSVCEPWQFGAYALCNEIVWSTKEDGGVPYVKAEAIQSPLIDEDALSYVTPDTHLLLDKSSLKAGDIIVSTSGTVGRLAVLPDTIRFANSNQDTIKFRVTGTDYDAYFVAAWLTSLYAQAYMQREAGGAVQQHIYLFNFRRLPLLKLASKSQLYIGDKVRQAERLRAWASALKQDVDSELDELKLPTDTHPKMLNRVEAQVLNQRLDPRPYRTHFQALVRAIGARNNDHCGALATLSSGCPVASEDFLEGSGISLIRIRNIRPEGFSGLDIGISEFVFKSNPQYQAKTNDIVVGMDGEFRAQFFLEDELPMFVNQRVAIIRATQIRPELLVHWLNRPEGQMQLNQWAVKTTVEHTSLPDIARVLIPRIAEDDEGRIADNLLYTRKARFFSGKLTNAAKLMVESLIEGHITQPQLIAAQHALDAGDDSLDRTILARLKTDGLDGAGEPLFPDLDQLYDLLERAKAEAEA